MMISTIEELDEMRAKAMSELWLGKKTNEAWRSFLPYTKHFREADERAGLVTVPKIATEEMRNVMHPDSNCIVGKGGKRTYEAMVAASPFAKKDCPP